MSRPDDFSKKKILFESDLDDCLCKNDQGLFIPNRQLSLIVAAFLFLFFGLFITGYFLGKRYESLQFTQKMNNDHFSDHVRNSVMQSAESNNQVANNSEITFFEKQEDTTLVINDSVITQGQNSDEEIVVSSENGDNDKRYYAPLIGFGTEKAAERFVQKLAAKGIETVIKKHTNKTAKGRIAHWYQVVTVPYADLQELTVLVDRITKEETLKGVCISTC